MSPHTYAPAAPQSGGRRAPLKAVQLLLQAPDPQVLDARIRAVSAREVGLILDRRLAEGSIVAFVNGRATAGDRRFLSARVAHAARLGPQGWLVRCRFAVPLSESELRALQG
jgi:hypothetical protein